MNAPNPAGASVVVAQLLAAPAADLIGVDLPLVDRERAPVLMPSLAYLTPLPVRRTIHPDVTAIWSDEGDA